MADQKHRLRKVMRECRRTLPPEQARALSCSIQSRALRLPFYREAAAVLLYAPVANEVATDLIFADACAAQRRIYYPVADPAARRLEFRAVASLDQLREGSFGIPQPRSGARFEAEPGMAAVVFVPGLAFSVNGQRLGRGGGFYDRFLDSTGPGLTAIGLGYSFQVLECLPQDRWDRRLACVVTEHAVHGAGCPG
jgi:5-formyltetrahydrofolate cyclo-ligase